MKIKRLLASLIITSIVFSLMPMTMFEALGADSEFYSSFEDGEEHTLIENSVLESSGMASSLSTYKNFGTSYTADPVYGGINNRGWDGTNVLKITGTHPSTGSAYSTNVIYDDLNILVYGDTQLSYVLLPNYLDYTSFDWEFTSQYIGIDLMFSDGTLLSELGAVDQYGHGLTGLEQGSNEHLYSKQWNQVKSNIGEVASGRIIEKILISYNKPSNDTGEELSIEAYLDSLSIKSVDTSPKNTPVEYANIFVGTNDKTYYSRGLQWPGVMTPNAFNIWCPSNYPVYEWVGSSSNKLWTPYTEAGITHFTTSHQASAWVGDFGRFQFMANTNYDPANASIISPDDRRTQYNEDTMVANPSYFSVELSDADNSPAKGVKMELSPTEHAASVRFTYPSDSKYANVVLDSIYSNGSMKLDGNTFTAVVNDSNGEGRSRYMHVYGEFDQTPTSLSKGYSQYSASGIINFESGTKSVTMKIATSFISAEQAKKNLELEISDTATFDDVKNSAAKTWNDLMGTIEVEGASEEEKVALYSNMYRLYADPLCLTENTGTAESPKLSYTSPYSGTDSSPSVVEGQMYYNNGFWDTFRGSWTAYQLLTPDYSTQLLNGIVQHYKDSNWVARWLAPGGRNSMVGTSSDIIFGDAIAKGITFDYENAYKASLKNASTYATYALKANDVEGFAGRAGMEIAPFHGYTPYAVDNGKGTSWALDNYLNDYGVSKLADALGYEDEAIYYKNTAQNYVNLWNYAGGGWFIGKEEDGTWLYDEGLVYSDTASNSVYNRSISDYEETNGFTMAWQSLQDVQGLINLYGGNENFTQRLDKFFTDETQYSGSGREYVLDSYDSKLGQYGQANQPDHHITYMYAYAGQPYKTQALTREILDRVYTGYSFNQGFPGDADNGEQAGWYIMTMLGFYPFSSGTDGYIITSPMHEKTTLNLPSGTLEIIANNNSDENVYIQSMTIDGKPYNEVFITYEDLIGAKEIKFEMGSEPSDWACDSAPPSITDADDDSVPNPLKDFTASGISVVDNVPENNHTNASAYVTNISEANAALLFDNTSSADATFTSNQGSIYYYFPSAQKVEMITMTSASALDSSAPNAFSLYGSNDGINWDLLDTNADIKYDWARQTKPFAIKNDNEYNYYRLDISAAKEISISEVEFMGYPTDIKDYPSTVDSETDDYTFDVIVDNSVTAVRFRDTDFNIVTPDSVSEAALNEDGTKTIKVVLSTDAYSVYITAMDSAGNEVTASRQTIKLKEEPEPEVDKSALRALVDECQELSSADYTDESWENFSEMLNEAEALLNNENATQDQINSMLTSLANAKANLVPIPVDKSALKALVDECQELSSADYTDESWENFSEMLNEAVNTLNNETASQAQVDKAFTALTNAKEALVSLPPKVDKSALQALVDECQELNGTDYTDESWQEFSGILNEAQNLLANASASQNQVDKAFNALTNAKEALVSLPPKVDKSALQALVDECQELNGTDYTNESWQEFSGILNEAVNILNNEAATQAQVDDAITALTNVKTNLVTITNPIDKTDLESEIAKAEVIESNLDKYEEAGKADFIAALKTAKEVLAKEDATQEEINAAMNLLKTSINALKLASEESSSTDSNSSNNSDAGKTGDTDLMYIVMIFLISLGLVACIAYKNKKSSYK